MLREEIEQRIKNNDSDPTKAAIAICKLLEWKLDLNGNGWFDDDELMTTELEKKDAFDDVLVRRTVGPKLFEEEKEL